MRRKEIQNKKLNARLYPIYKMVSWDLLFYYSIIYLFLVQAKGFTASQVLLSEAFFTALCLILQIPLGLLVDRFGKKNSLVFANICLCIYILILLFINSYTQLLIALFINAIGYAIKGICESNILYDSLPRGKKRGSLFSWIDGKGTSRYYVVDAITSFIAGYAFVVSPYLPIILCLIGNIVATILSTRFRHTKIPIEDDDDIRTGAKEYFKQLKEATKFAITSKRMLCLLIFFGIFAGLNYNLTTFRSGILEQIQLPEQYFGVVLAMVQIASATCSGLQGIIHKKFRNKTLTILGIPMTSFLILIGVFALGNPTNFKTIAIIALFVILGGVKGAHNVLIYRYLNNFTNREIRTKLSTLRNVVYNLFTIGISLLGSWLLSITNASNSIIILGIIATAIMVLLLYYMKDKVGLKVDNYSDEDLKYSHVIK
jgi:MFS family permease